MKYAFDACIERRGTGSTKWDNLGMRVSNTHALPMWVADSDFACPEPVVKAVQDRAAHPIYGYAFVPRRFGEVTAGWMRRRHGWEADPEWVIFSPGVVPALSMAVLAFTEPGDEVIIQRPVYHPFTNVVKENGRLVSSNSLKLEDGRYEIDFEDLEKRAASPRAKLMFLCSPHNPTGRVFSEEELLRIGDICEKYGVLLVSDEIHGDIIFGGRRHVPAGSLDRPWAAKTITCVSPSKTFNIAGLEAAAVIVRDEAVRGALRAKLQAMHIDVPNAFAMAGYCAAYTECEDYLEQELAYLRGNIRFVADTFRQSMPKLHLVEPEGTYLLWIDCREMGLTAKETEDFFVEEAAVAINPGNLFGEEGAGFVRLNIACPMDTVKKAMAQIQTAYNRKEVTQ